MHKRFDGFEIRPDTTVVYTVHWDDQSDCRIFRPIRFKVSGHVVKGSDFCPIDSSWILVNHWGQGKCQRSSC